MARRSDFVKGAQSFGVVFNSEMKERVMEELGRTLGGKVNPKLLSNVISKMGGWIKPEMIPTVLMLLSAVPLSGMRFFGSRYSSELGKETSDILEGALEKIIRGVANNAQAFQQLSPQKKEEMLMEFADGKGQQPVQQQSTDNQLEVTGFDTVFGLQVKDGKGQIRMGLTDAELTRKNSILMTSPEVAKLRRQHGSTKFNLAEVRTVLSVEDAKLVESVKGFLEGKTKKPTKLDQVQGRVMSVVEQGVHPDTAAGVKASLTIYAGRVASRNDALGQGLDRAPRVGGFIYTFSQPGAVKAFFESGIVQLLILIGFLGFMIKACGH